MVWLACVTYLAGYTGYSFSGFSDSIGALRYAVYVAPLVLLLPPLTGSAFSVNRPALFFFLGYATQGFVALLVGVNDRPAFGDEFVIFLLIAASFVPTIKVKLWHIQMIFTMSVIYFAVVFSSTDHGGVRLLQMLQSGTGSGVETGFDNHEGGIVGPLYFIFFASIGSKLYAALAMTMSVLGGKRIGVVAIIVGLTALVLFRRAAILQSRNVRFFVLLACLLLINFVGTNLNSISNKLYQNLSLQVSLEEVMLGRYSISSELTGKIREGSAFETLFGRGAGAANATATIVTDGTLTLPHNDWLKISYDYGIVGSIALTIFLARMFSRNAVSASLLLTAATMMTTDNVLGYLFYQFVLVLMLGCAGERSPGALLPAFRLRRQHVVG